jgi:hypothetical protein
VSRVYASLPISEPAGCDSILGRYSIDADGHTTSTAYGRLAVAGGELVWDRG